MKITKSDIKGVLKIALIIVLVAAAIGGTCYLFFKYLNSSEEAFDEVGEYVYSVERDEFLSDLNTINNYTSSGRLNDLINTYEDLQKVAKVLLPYLSIYDIDDDEIVSQLSTLLTAQEEVDEDIETYLGRITDITFDKTDVNTLYSDLANYLVEYANLISIINSEIESAAKYQSVDIKFSVIDCYTHIVKNTFSNLTTSAPIEAESLDSLNLISTILNFENINIVITNTSDDIYVTINNFITTYDLCDKDAFATNFYTNVKNVTEINDDSSLIERATYYLKVIFKLEVA